MSRDDEYGEDGPVHDPHEAGTPEGEEDPFGSRKHRRRRRKSSLPGQNISHLNLTPMMDIMTMLLVFLVKSFATEPANINVNLSLHPPASSSETTIEAATKVTITSDVILVDDKEVMPTSAVDPKAEQPTIAQLRDALLERADHLKALEARGGEPFDGRLLVVAHETTPYSLITSVLVTAGDSKFSEYKLVVMQKADD